MTRISKVFGFPVVIEASSTSQSLFVSRGAAVPPVCPGPGSKARLLSKAPRLR